MKNSHFYKKKTYLSNYLFTYLPTYLFIYLHVYLSIYLIIYLLIYLHIYLPTYLLTRDPRMGWMKSPHFENGATKESNHPTQGGVTFKAPFLSLSPFGLALCWVQMQLFIIQ
jgi:hypothetical protein